MNFFLDENFPKSAHAYLTQCGHSCIFCGIAHSL